MCCHVLLGLQMLSGAHGLVFVSSIAASSFVAYRGANNCAPASMDSAYHMVDSPGLERLLSSSLIHVNITLIAVLNPEYAVPISGDNVRNTLSNPKLAYQGAPFSGSERRLETRGSAQVPNNCPLLARK